MRRLFETGAHRWQVQFFQILQQRRSDLRGRAHCSTSRALHNWSKRPFDVLQEKLGRRQGSKEYLRILELAAKDSEVKVDEALRALLEGGSEEISAQEIETMLGIARCAGVRDVQVAAVDLVSAPRWPSM